MANIVKDPISVSIIGGSGYTGAELIRLISNHPHFELNQVVSLQLDFVHLLAIEEILVSRRYLELVSEKPQALRSV